MDNLVISTLEVFTVTLIETFKIRVKSPNAHPGAMQPENVDIGIRAYKLDRQDSFRLKILVNLKITSTNVFDP